MLSSINYDRSLPGSPQIVEDEALGAEREDGALEHKYPCHPRMSFPRQNIDIEYIICEHESRLQVHTGSCLTF